MTRRRLLVACSVVPLLGGACHAAPQGESAGAGSGASGSSGNGGSGGARGASGSTSSGSTASGSGGSSTSSGGAPVPPPTLDADGCPSLAAAGAASTFTALPSGITKTYYVSAAGKDTNTGTDPNDAFQTVAPVQALLGAGTIAGGSAILFRAGDVFHGTLTLTAKNTGTASAPVVIGAYGTGAAPTLVGTQPVASSSFTAMGANFVAPITGSPARLFFGDAEVFPARFPNADPNEGNAVVRAVSGSSTTITLNASSLMGLPVQGAEAWVRSQSWRRDRVLVDSVATSGSQATLTVSKTESDPGAPSNAATGVSTPVVSGAGVYFEGLLAYLDTAGEWAEQGGSLYLRPPGGAPIASQPIEVSLPGSVIGANGVTNLVIQDLHVDRGEGAGIDVKVTGAGPTIRNNTVTSSYYTGIYLHGAPASPVVTGNTVTGSRNFGIQLAGTSGAQVTHNLVASSGSGQHATYGVGIADFSSTGGDLIDHNFIHDVGQAGIEFGTSTGVTVSRNVVVRSPSYFGDAGGVYWNFDGGGIVVAQNVFCKTSANVDDAIPTAIYETNGIYLDADVRPAIIKQNTVLRAVSCGFTAVSHTTDVDTPGGPLVPSHTVVDNVFVGSGDAAGMGKEGAQFCYKHAYENGTTTPTLGQLKSVTGNVFVPIQTWQRAYRLSSYEANHDFGAIDENTFALPLAQGIVYDTSPSTPAGLYSLDAWRVASGGKDMTSTVGAPQRTACDLVSIDGPSLCSGAQAWQHTSSTGCSGLKLPAPASGMTQAWIANQTPFAATVGTRYLVELSTTSSAPQLYSVYLTNATEASTGAASIGNVTSDAASQRAAFVVTATGAGITLQIVAGAALTVDEVKVRPVTTGECAPSLWDRLSVLTNTTDATQTYEVGSGWLDLKGAAVPGTVTVASFQSVVLQRADLAF